MNDTDIQARAREIAADLTSLDRAYLKMTRQPMNGRERDRLDWLRGLGLVECDNSWRKTDLGHAVAAVLAEGDR